MTQSWYAVSVVVPPEYVEPAESAFNQLDCLGTEVDMLSKRSDGLWTVRAYFSAPLDTSSIREAFAEAASILGLSQEIELHVRTEFIKDQDWLAEWKKHWRPVEIGQYVVAAPWHEVEQAGKSIIRIEPNMAFGTGTHETTQLCLAAIDERYRPRWSFLDVGTGTGILAIAAALRSDPEVRVAAVDNDEDAVAIARDNASLNDVGERVELAAGTFDYVAGRFDMICANLTADVILPILDDLIARADRLLVLSGILAEQENMITSSLPDGLQFSVSRAGEWIAVTVETRSSVEIA